MHGQWQTLFATGILPLLTICTIGSAVEFCWAAGEAVLVPFLGRHGVRQWVVSTIYLANPILGLFVQPRLGAWSDRINRRVPFVVGLSLIALVGIATIISAFPLTQVVFGLQNIHDNNDESSNDKVISSMAIVLVFVGFGAADICFDCLLIPGRALLDDLTVPTGRSDEANALFTGFQLGGRLLALLAGSSSLTTSGLFGLYKDSTDAHFSACFTLSALSLISSTSLVVFLVDDKGSIYQSIPSDDENSFADNGIEDVEIHEDDIVHHDDQSIIMKSSKQAIHNVPDDTSWLSKVDACMLLFAVQAVGWVSVTAQSFFWTAWRGEEVGCIDLAIQGVVGMVTAGLLPIANAYFGAASVWCGSELLFHLLMMSTGLVSSNSNIPRIIAALSGINYAVHATNALIVATDLLPDPNKRARTIAMVNNALPLGQLITALSGGLIAQLGGFEYALVCYGFLGVLVTSAVWGISSKQCLFSKQTQR